MKTKFTSVSETFSLPIEANIEVTKIAVLPVTGLATLCIGTIAGGDDILEETLLYSFVKNRVDQYFVSGCNLYFTFSGEPGTINITVYTKKEVF